MLIEIIFMSKIRKNGGCTKCEFDLNLMATTKNNIGARQVKFDTYVNIKNDYVLYETRCLMNECFVKNRFLQ